MKEKNGIKARRLTQAQRRVIKHLQAEGSFALLIRSNNSYKYRILTEDRKPVENIQERVFLRIKGWFTEAKMIDNFKVHVLNDMGKKVKFRKYDKQD